MNAVKSYQQFIVELKQNIIQSRYQAARLVNREQLLLYINTGQILSEKIAKEKWGSKVLEEISIDLQKQLPGLRGFSHRNLKKMRQFFEAYKGGPIWQSLTAKLQTTENKTDIIRPSVTAQLTGSENKPGTIVQLSTAQLEAFLGISFTHHLLILNKCSEEEERSFYIQKAANEYWSVTVLEHQISSCLYNMEGKLPNNFTKTLTQELTPSALQLFRDEYLMDFMSINEEEDEREIENKVVGDIRNFILRMGKGFSFIGNQFRIELNEEEFFIDLLFFNRHLQCLVAFELKKGKFKPEYAGQLNFYLNVLDEKVKLPNENSSIGIVLCKEKNNTVVEFSVRSIDKAMGVATFKTSKEIPKEIKGVLPDTDELKNLF